MLFLYHTLLREKPELHNACYTNNQPYIPLHSYILRLYTHDDGNGAKEEYRTGRKGKGGSGEGRKVIGFPSPSPRLPFASGGNSNVSSGYCTFTVRQYFFILRLGRSSWNAESCWRIGGTYSGSEPQEFVTQRNPKTYFENSVLHRTTTHGRATVIFGPLWWVAKPKNYINVCQMQWGYPLKGKSALSGLS